MPHAQHNHCGSGRILCTAANGGGGDASGGDGSGDVCARFAPFLAALPRPPDALPLWSEAERAELQFDPALRALEAFARRAGRVAALGAECARLAAAQATAAAGKDAAERKLAPLTAKLARASQRCEDLERRLAGL